MGRSIFVCRVDTRAEFDAAMRDVAAHNATVSERLATRSDAEAAAVDPMRAAAFAAVRHLGPIQFGLRAQFTRGDRIDTTSITLVGLLGRTWLEVSTK